MKAYTMLPEDLTTVSNQAKEITVGALLSQGIITQKQADDFCGNYTIVIVERGRLGQFFDKITFRSGESETRMLCLQRSVK